MRLDTEAALTSNFQYMPKTQVDFADSLNSGGKSVFLASTTSTITDSPGIRTASFVRLDKNTTYQITVSGQTIQGEARIFAQNLDTKLSILDRIDIRLNHISSSKTQTVALATTGKSAVDVQIGVVLANPSIGDEFVLNSISIDKQEGLVTGPVRMVATVDGTQTSVFNPYTGQWDEAMVIKHDLDAAISIPKPPIFPLPPGFNTF